MSGLNLTFNELKREVCLFLGYDDQDPDGLDLDTQRRVENLVHSGIRMFLYPTPHHTWRFLRPRQVVELVEDQYEYELPAYFYMLQGPIVFEAGDNVLYPAIELVSEYQVYQRHQLESAAGRPTIAALVPHVVDKVETRWKLVVWRTPDDEYSISFPCLINPDKLTGDDSVPHGGPPHAETLREACLAAAEQTLEETLGQHTERFRECLAGSIERDREMGAPETLGINRDTSDYPYDPSMNWHDFDQNLVTYTGYDP